VSWRNVCNDRRRAPRFQSPRHGLGAGFGAGLEYADLILDAAVVAAVILVAAAGGQDGAPGVTLENRPNHVDTLFRAVQVIQAELEERFAGCGFAVGVLEKLSWVGNAEGDANPGE